MPPNSFNIDSEEHPPMGEEFFKGLWRQNPVFVQVLGMCPTMAVSNSVINGLAMGLATGFVLLMSNLTVSVIRQWIPYSVRIGCFVLVIATFVTITDIVIQAIDLELHRALGAFIYLIVVNCLILSRAEAFAVKNTPNRAVLDALGMGCGFTLALLVLSGIREVLGSGSFLNMAIMPDGFQPWLVMLLPSGGFFTLGLFLLATTAVQRWRNAHE